MQTSLNGGGGGGTLYSQPSLKRRCWLPNNVTLNRIAVVMNLNSKCFHTFVQLQLTL